MSPLRAGILVGGASRRMGTPKGNLVFRGRSLLERAVDVVENAGLVPVLVGDATPYEGILPDVPRLSDAPPSVGPLGGLRALLLGGSAIAFACDMPHVTSDALRALCAWPDASYVGARRGEPFPAFYGGGTLSLLNAQLASGRYSVRAFIDLLSSRRVLDLEEEICRDWDRPEDIEP